MAPHSTMRPLRLAWASDIHFDKCGPEARNTWARQVIGLDPDLLVITGDISHNRRILADLDWIGAAVSPIETRFILGNHDFRNPSHEDDRDSEDVRDDVRGLVASRDACDLVYVQHVEPTDRECEIPGYPGAVILGVDGWWDCRAGIEYNKRVAGSSYRGSTAQIYIAKNARIADLDTWILRPRLEKAIHRGATDIIVLTHVPPWPAVCLHNGRPSEPHLIQYYSNVGLGTMLEEVAAANRRVRFLVLCGHTHDDAYAQIAPNLRVAVQGAGYGEPAAQLVEIDAVTREVTLGRRGRLGPWYELDRAPLPARESAHWQT